MNTILQDKPVETIIKFSEDVILGLKSEPKSLSSKYFYDEKGDKIFQQIMNMEEYYLTKAEMDILVNQADNICNAITADGDSFDLIELGAGDATKSIHLLKALTEKGLDFSYLPIDISEHVIADLEGTLPLKVPQLNIKGFNGDYFEMLGKATAFSSRRKVVLFMGANIGNMTVADAQKFCIALKEQLSENDLLIIGFDLKKNPKQILAAYNDKNGITKSFNINLLNRINNELNGNFNLNSFEHYACYDPQSGACKSYLISLEDQSVNIGTYAVSFKKNEYIFMEISQKYALNEIDALANTSGFSPVENFFDANRYFVDALWKVE